MVVRVTQALRDQLQAIGADPQEFADTFEAWKAAGPAGEYGSYHFGKDGGYVSPPVNGVKYVLKHAHIVPLCDEQALTQWEAQWRRRARKTSDRVLVYVSDQTHGHLLLYILQEPTAHEVARMATAQTKTLMMQLATVAGSFVHDGSIIA